MPLLRPVRPAASRPLNAAAAGRGPRPARMLRLGGTFRRRMEDAFGEDFADVTVEPSDRARAITGALGAVAAAAGNSIYLGAGFFTLPRESRRHVLAHELAHVVQKRRFDPAAAPAVFGRDARLALEAEAERAAAAAIRGRPASIALQDRPDIAAPWGPAGHYYTSYFVMLAAGVDPDRAFHRAFFCQMPDQVHEFDAISATLDVVDYYGGSFPAWLVAQSLDTKILTPPSRGVEGFAGAPNPDLHWEKRTTYYTNIKTDQVYEVDISGYAYATPTRRLEIDREVTEGLHALTGGWASSETEFREGILKSVQDDDLAFGLALHPYGDSFAHRQIHNPKLMYDAGHGGHAMDGHDPDNLGERLGEGGIYLQYAESLYKLCQGEKPRLSLKDTKKVLSFLTDVKEDIKNLDPDGNDHLACTLLRTLATNTRGMLPLDGYGKTNPEFEKPSYWCQFSKTHQTVMNEFGGADSVFAQVRKYGQQWFKARLYGAAKEKAAEEAAAAVRREQRLSEIMKNMPRGAKY